MEKNKKENEKKRRKKKRKEKSAKNKKSIHLQHHVQRNKVKERGLPGWAGVLGMDARMLLASPATIPILARSSQEVSSNPLPSNPKSWNVFRSGPHSMSLSSKYFKSSALLNLMNSSFVGLMGGRKKRKEKKFAKSERKEKKRRKKNSRKEQTYSMAGTGGDWVTGCDDADEGEDEGCPSFCCSVCEKRKGTKGKRKKENDYEIQKKKNQNHTKRSKNDWKDDEKI